MREIKFRAWDVLSKKMLSWGDIFHLPAWEIFPGTPEQRAFDVMQYIGIKDANGKEIFERDILQYPGGRIGLVKWTNYYGAPANFCLNCETSFSLFLQPEGKSRAIVIGNIYENPELFKE